MSEESSGDDKKAPFCYSKNGYQPTKTEWRTLTVKNKANDTYSLAHTSWKSQYHIVFAPKYRRKAIYGKLKAEIGAILRELCERKHVNIIEAHAMADHIHMLVEIPPNQRVSDLWDI